MAARGVLERGGPADSLVDALRTATPCLPDSTAARLLAALWQEPIADSIARVSLQAASTRVAGQVLFRAALETLRHEGSPATMRFTAMGFLAGYVAPWLRLEVPKPPGALVTPFSTHWSFNEYAEYEPFAPDTLLATLRALIRMASDTLVRRAAAQAHAELAPVAASPRFQAAEQARRAGVAQRAVGCYAMHYLAAWPTDSVTPLARVARRLLNPDTVELLAEQHRQTYTQGARVLRGTLPGAFQWWIRGPDTVIVDHSDAMAYRRVRFPLGDAESLSGSAIVRVRPGPDSVAASAMVQRIACRQP